MKEVGGPDALVTAGDLTDPEVRRNVVNRTIERFGGIDILINNAGIGLYSPAWKAPLDETRAMFELNFFAPLAMVQLVVPSMRERGGGMLVNIGSIAGKTTLPWFTLYSSTKFALGSFTEGLGMELAGDNIRTMVVCPGYVKTGFQSHALVGRPPDRLLKGKKFAITAEECAAAVARRSRAQCADGGDAGLRMGFNCTEAAVPDAGRSADEEDLSGRSEVITKLKQTPGLYLMGFMGSGKTTVGKLLAERLGWSFVDIDQDIEVSEQRTITEIFDTVGRGGVPADGKRGDQEAGAGGSVRTADGDGAGWRRGRRSRRIWSCSIRTASPSGSRVLSTCWCGARVRMRSRPLSRDLKRFEELFHARRPCLRTRALPHRKRDGRSGRSPSRDLEPSALPAMTSSKAGAGDFQSRGAGGRSGGGRAAPLSRCGMGSLHGGGAAVPAGSIRPHLRDRRREGERVDGQGGRAGARQHGSRAG